MKCGGGICCACEFVLVVGAQLVVARPEAGISRSISSRRASAGFEAQLAHPCLNTAEDRIEIADFVTCEPCDVKVSGQAGDVVDGDGADTTTSASAYTAESPQTPERGEEQVGMGERASVFHPEHERTGKQAPGR